MNKYYIFFFFISLIAVVLRLAGYAMVSDDMSGYLIPWFDHIKNNGGIFGLSQQVGDYGLLYQTIIALFTYVDINPIYLYKTFSVLFDFLLALSIAYFVKNSDSGTYIREKSFYYVYASVLLLPTVVLNSAFWGQCDSVYTFFLLWSVWFLHKEKYKQTFFMLGWALAFKLQSILLFPLFIYAYFAKNNFTFLNSFITLFVFWSSGIIAYIHGRGLLAGFRIYLFQVGEYESMWKNVPSFWVIGGDDYDKLFFLAICITFLILALGLFWVMVGRKPIDSFEQTLGFALFIEWTCILFLPAMHERYTYVLDLLALMLSFINKKYITYAFITITMSCITYNNYLFFGTEINSWLVIIYLFAWLNFSCSVFKRTKDNTKQLSDSPC